MNMLKCYHKGETPILIVPSPFRMKKLDFIYEDMFLMMYLPLYSLMQIRLNSSQKLCEIVQGSLFADYRYIETIE